MTTATEIRLTATTQRVPSIVRRLCKVCERERERLKVEKKKKLSFSKSGLGLNATTQD
jgi:hypothetical protein